MKKLINNFNSKVIYEIYVKSFNDSNNDGIGDLQGIINKLDYIKELGVDYIWLTPIYESPLKDNGYDISNYYKINNLFGTMEDFDNLILETKKRNIHVMLDMVLNHVSIESSYYQDLLKGKKDNEKLFYLIDGNEKELPNNWKSKFGGSAWKYDNKLKKWYLHLFDESMIDTNWNSKIWKDEAYKIINFWLDKGIGGIRFDVMNLYSKNKKFPNDEIGDGRRFYTDHEGIHEIIKDIRKNTFSKYKDVFTIAELSSTNTENILGYTKPENQEVGAAFSFMHLKVDYVNKEKWTPNKFKFEDLFNSIKEIQLDVSNKGGVNANFLNNHDQPRANSRFLPNVDNYLRTTLLFNFYSNLKGVTTIFQGEEFGMTDLNFNKEKQFTDVESINAINEFKEKGFSKKLAIEKVKYKSRDNARSPMWWDSTKNAGFSNTNSDQYLPRKIYKKINLEKDKKKINSIFNDYKKIIKIKKNSDDLNNSDISFTHIDNDLCVYKRNNYYIINNFSNKTFNIRDYIMFENYNVHYSNREISNKILPYQTITIEKK